VTAAGTVINSAAAASDSPKLTQPAVTDTLPSPEKSAASKSRNLRAKSRLRPAKTAAPAPKEIVVVPSATIDLAVVHQFKEATLFVWVDDKLALTRPLHGATQKKLVLFNGVHGIESESLKIPAGKHVLRFRALSTDQTSDLSKTISADFVGGDEKSLQVTFDKHNTMMRLTWR
jgi:hypothetical protein